VTINEVSRAIRILQDNDQRRADQQVRDIKRSFEEEKEKMHKDKSKFVCSIRKKLNRLVGMQKGIF
jgi:hypothetical protein